MLFIPLVYRILIFYCGYLLTYLRRKNTDGSVCKTRILTITKPY